MKSICEKNRRQTESEYVKKDMFFLAKIIDEASLTDLNSLISLNPVFPSSKNEEERNHQEVLRKMN